MHTALLTFSPLFAIRFHFRYSGFSASLQIFFLILQFISYASPFFFQFSYRFNIERYCSNFHGMSGLLFDSFFIGQDYLQVYKIFRISSVHFITMADLVQNSMRWSWYSYYSWIFYDCQWHVILLQVAWIARQNRSLLILKGEQKVWSNERY